tara:strand:- start:39 stop:467 length:429 start_codon:yes stop_codon:yes gene_type:complete
VQVAEAFFCTPPPRTARRAGLRLTSVSCGVPVYVCVSRQPTMPFFMVQHNITDSEFYAKNVAEMIKGAMGMGPMGPGEQEALGLSKETEVTDSCLHPAALGGDQTLYQHSINFPAGNDAKIGCASASLDPSNSECLPCASSH